MYCSFQSTCQNNYFLFVLKYFLILEYFGNYLSKFLSILRQGWVSTNSFVNVILRLTMPTQVYYSVGRQCKIDNIRPYFLWEITHDIMSLDSRSYIYNFDIRISLLFGQRFVIFLILGNSLLEIYLSLLTGHVEIVLSMDFYLLDVTRNHVRVVAHRLNPDQLILCFDSIF